MKNTSTVLMFLCAAVIFISFFLSWASVDSSVKGAVVKVFNSKKDASIMQVSGFQVPILANRSDSHMMISIIKIFNPGIQDADKKSWLIWGVPFFAVLLAGAWVLLKGNKWFCFGVGILGILIFVLGGYQIMTTNLNKLVMKVVIMPGVWLTLTGYLGMGVVCLATFFQKKGRP